MQRQIMHIDLDSFFVSVERLNDPSLEGKPVVVGGASARGVVASCSYEARKYGVHSAMPMHRAKQLCPAAVVVKGDYAQYTLHSNAVTDIIADTVPLYEKASIDEFYIDLSGTERFFGAYKLATELRRKIIRDTGLPISFALSTSKTVSKIGTGLAKPNGQKEIPAGTEKEFLSPLHVRKIPMVGEKTCQILKEQGIELIRDLQEMPLITLQRKLGDSALVLWNKAHGIDPSPVEQYNARKSISTECTFEKDLLDTDHIRRVLISMTEKLCFQLRSEEKLSACVTLKLRYADFSTQSMQAKIPYTALDSVLLEKAKELFGRLYQPGSYIRLVGVKFSHLISGTYQFDLFSDTGEQVELTKAMDKLRQRFGEAAVTRAATLGLAKRDTNLFNKNAGPQNS